MSNDQRPDYGGDYSLDTTWSILGGLGLAVIAVLMLGGVFFHGKEMDPFWEFSLGVVGIILAVVAGLQIIYWSIEHVVSRIIGAWEAARYAEAVTRPEIVLFDRAAKTDPEQLKFMRDYIPMISAIGGSAGPLYSWRTLRGEVPLSFVRDFLDMTVKDGSRYFLPPVRTWADGSREREYAQWLTSHFETCGLAQGAIGNKSAEWKNYDFALMWSGRAKMDILLEG